MPLALTPKSVCGSEAAQSCEGCAAVWMTAARSAPTRSNRRSTPSASRMSSSSVRNSALNSSSRRCGGAGGGGLRAEEPRAHVVLDPDHVVARAREVGDGLGPDQPAGARHDDRGHQLSVNSRAGRCGSGGERRSAVALADPARGGRSGHSSAIHVDGRQHHVHPDEPGRQRELPLDDADGALAGDQDADRGHRAHEQRVLSRRRTRNQTPTAASPRTVPVVEWRSIAQLSVSPGPCQVIRSTTSPVPAPPACGPAAVTIVPPVSDAKPDRQQRPDRPHAHLVAARRPRAGLERRPPRQRDVRHQQQHRQQEVHDHPARRQVEDDREAAPHGLRGDADRQQRGDQQQVAPERPPPPRHPHREQARDRRRRSSSSGCRTRSACGCSARA